MEEIPRKLFNYLIINVFKINKIEVVDNQDVPLRSTCSVQKWNACCCRYRKGLSLTQQLLKKTADLVYPVHKVDL